MFTPCNNKTTMSMGVLGQFHLEREIGKGSFGKVYIARDPQKRLVGLKVEHDSQRAILRHEYEIYKHLKAVERRSKPLVPDIYWFGKLDGKTVLSMECLGNSLEFLFSHRCQGRFSPKTTLMLAIQMLDLIATLHCCGIVHRDIKPDNFLMGLRDNRQRLYLIDFGLAKEFKRGSHIRETTGKSLVGTARYASVHSHQGLELSRRDDLESIGYLWIYFLKGRLPWQGIHVPDKHKKYKAIGECKMSTSLDELCMGVAPAYRKYFEYVRALQFKQRPDYAMLRGLLVQSFLAQGFEYDMFDWEVN